MNVILELYVGEWYIFGGNSEWSGDKYVGGHKDGFGHGQGTYTYKNGQKLVAEWRDGKVDGFGTTYSADGSIIETRKIAK